VARPRSNIATRIVHAARAQFLSAGVDGASLRRIAEAARTNLGMVYYYYPSKDDLFLAVVEEIYVGLLADLEAALAPQRPPLDRIHQLYARLGRLSEDELLVLRIVLREVLANPARLDGLIARFQKGHLPLVLRLVEDGFAAGLFQPELPARLVLIAMMLLGGPAQALLQRVGRLLPLPAPAGPLAPQLVELFLTGVAAKPEPTPRRRPRRPRARPKRPR
jgi:AcrR family transcriptional regulator